MIHLASVLSPLYAHAAADADCMIVDSPYAPKVHAKAISAGTGGAGVRKRDLGFACLTPALMNRVASYAAQVRRWSIVFTDLESTHLWRKAMHTHGVEYVRTVPWIRWSQPQMSGDRPPTGAEAICIFHRTHGMTRSGRIKPMQKRWNGPGNRVAYRSEDVAEAAPSPAEDSSPLATRFDASACSGAEPVARAEYTARSLRGADKYSCEKPLDLMLALVSDYSDPGETVFDPCCGSGTTCLAAQLLGRATVGIDCSAEAVARAHDRVAMPLRLSARDEERAVRWVLETREEARRTPFPKAANGSDVRTYERAQRRLADAAAVVRNARGS